MNKQLKDFKDKYHPSEEENEECQQQIQMIKNLFDLENYDEPNKELQSLIYRENKFCSIIYKIIRKSISPRYKNFIYHVKCNKIEKK